MMSKTMVQMIVRQFKLVLYQLVKENPSQLLLRRSIPAASTDAYLIVPVCYNGWLLRSLNFAVGWLRKGLLHWAGRCLL